MTEFFVQLESLPAYQQIAVAYEGKTARWSSLPYISHIHDGAALLFLSHGFDEELLTVFCLHPLFQKDPDDSRLSHLPKPLWEAGREYARLANAYGLRSALRVPEISQSAFVNQLLIADKIQNKHDFQRYIAPKIRPRAVVRCVAYFDSWLSALGINQGMYQRRVTALEALY